MNKSSDSLVEWCEASVSRYEFSQFISEFTNSFSNIAFLLVSFYSSGNHFLCDYSVRLLAIGSFMFHATESYKWQLADELSMSLLACFYYLPIQHHFIVHSTILQKITNYMYPISLSLVWFIYIKYKLYFLFVSFFAIQVSLPLYMVTFVMPTTDQQKFDLAKGAFFAIGSVGCWSYERYLHSIGLCPNDTSDYRYYLHSYWHIGMAAAHFHFMRCIDKFTVSSANEIKKN